MERTEKSRVDQVQMNQQALTGDSDGMIWAEFERDVMRWAKPRYGTSYTIGLWCNLWCDISRLDLEDEEDFDVFKVECNKVHEIIATEPYATVVYSKKWFWTKRWQEDYRRDQRLKLYEYLKNICRGEPLIILEEEGMRWSTAVGGPRFELYSRFGRIDPAVLNDRVLNYCQGMPGVGGVTTWPQEVNLLDKLEKLEQEYNFLRGLPKEDTKKFDRVTTEEKLVEIGIDCVPSWCNDAVDLAREISRQQQTDMVCGQTVLWHRQQVPESRH
jgi:hypothetical protein